MAVSSSCCSGCWVPNEWLTAVVASMPPFGVVVVVARSSNDDRAWQSLQGLRFGVVHHSGEALSRAVLGP